MALAKMPVALDLTTTEKGYFPHLFNRVENENYFGPYPRQKFYNYDNMSDKDRESLMRGTAQLRASGLTSGKNCTRTALTTSSYYAKAA